MFQACLYTLSSKECFDDCNSVSLPVASGEVEIMTNHAEVFGILVKGSLTVRRGGGEKQLAVTGGQFHFMDNKLVILD